MFRHSSPTMGILQHKAIEKKPKSPSPRLSPAEPPAVAFPYCPNVSKYEKLHKIGQGTFGEVHKARDRRSGRFVALKKVMINGTQDGFPLTTIREIRILQQVKHKHIVDLIEVVSSASSDGLATIYLVFDFCDHDLAGLLSPASNITFSLGEKKMILKQLLEALFFIHMNKVIHRDLKAANILITREGVLKLADFGLSRPIDSRKKYTPRVVTLWYRPPELLLGSPNYGPPVDLWGAGCIMIELWSRRSIMPGNSETHQLGLITELCGSITNRSWPGCQDLPYFSKLNLPTNYLRSLRQKLASVVDDSLAIDLIDRMLALDPNKRIDADQALDHDFFWTDPLPMDLKPLFSGQTDSYFDLSHGRPFWSNVNRPQNIGRTDDKQYRDIVF